jgi:hypothetical protein
MQQQQRETSGRLWRRQTQTQKKEGRLGRRGQTACSNINQRVPAAPAGGKPAAPLSEGAIDWPTSEQMLRQAMQEQTDLKPATNQF